MNFLLVTLVLTLHLACMNAATAGPLVCIWLDWREGRVDAVAGGAGRYLAGWSLILFLVGLVLGLGMAILVWTWEFWRELQTLLPSRIYWGYWELGFSAVLLAGYWVWWRFAPGRTAARFGRSFVAVFSSTNLLYHFPPLFVVAAMVAAGEAESLGPIDNSTFPRLIWRGEVFALTVHFWLASLAVAGVLLATYALKQPRKDSAEEQPARAARWGGAIALGATLLQIPVGLWLMMELPLLRQTQLMGGDLIGTSLLGGGVVLVLVLLHQLAGMTMGDARRATILRTAAILLAVITLMTAALRWSRPEEDADLASLPPLGVELDRGSAEHRREDVKQESANDAPGPDQHNVLDSVNPDLHPTHHIRHQAADPQTKDQHDRNDSQGLIAVLKHLDDDEYEANQRSKSANQRQHLQNHSHLATPR